MKHSIYIITADMFAGGAERVIAQLANYLSRKKYTVKIITIYDSKLYYSLDSNIEVISIGRKSKNKLFNKISQYGSLRRIIKKDMPEVILTMPEDTGVYVIASLVGIKVPVYVSERNNPWVMPDVKITRLLRQLVYRKTKGIIFQTEMAKSFFPKSIQRKGIILKNPVDDTRIPEVHKGERSKTIAAVGRLASQKNYFLLIDAFCEFWKNHKEYELHIYGDGPEKNRLSEYILAKGMSSNITLKGRDKDVLSKIVKCAFFVLSSDYEGMPNVLIEAMCMGLPVISTNCPSGGPRELIENNVNGILIDVGDKNALVEAMSKMTDMKFSSKLGSNAYLLRKELTDTHVFEEWEEYLMIK